jgi:hypothetical protein
MSILLWVAFLLVGIYCAGEVYEFFPKSYLEKNPDLAAEFNVRAAEQMKRVRGEHVRQWIEERRTKRRGRRGGGGEMRGKGG